MQKDAVVLQAACAIAVASSADKHCAEGCSCTASCLHHSKHTPSADKHYAEGCCCTAGCLHRTRHTSSADNAHMRPKTSPLCQKLFCCPKAFLSLEFWCRDNVFDSKWTFWDCKTQHNNNDKPPQGELQLGSVL